MASATAVLWGFNFILSFSWPPLVEAFQPQGAFGWYAAWCVILWCLGKSSCSDSDSDDDAPGNFLGFSNTRFPFPVLLFFPETKELTLEELDAVFNVATHKQMAHGFKEPCYWISKGIRRRDVDLPPLVDIDELRGTRGDQVKTGDA